MPAFIDLTGRVYGRLTVISCAGQQDRARIKWKCRCSCGSEVSISGTELRCGDTKSCGCLRVETTIKRLTKHGAASSKAKTATYATWQRMIQRCSNPNAGNWKHYGGRGIEVCERWQDFGNFVADMGEKLPGKSIERVDNDAGYSPENCIWADRKTQSRNKQNTRFITLNGASRTIASICEEYGITHQSVR
jgi:hypothetical protein